MRKIWLTIITVLLAFAFVACTNDDSSQPSDDLPQSSSVPESSSLPENPLPPNNENSEWEDIEFPRP